MPEIRSTKSGQFILSVGPVGGYVRTSPAPSDVRIPAPLMPPATVTPIISMNGLFANPGPPGNLDYVVWAPSPYTWTIQFEGPFRRIFDPRSGRFWVNTENIISLSTEASLPETTFEFLGN